MRGLEKVVVLWIAILLAIVLCILLGPFLPWSSHRILHSATAAAWAQTVGTVAAMVCGAGAIAWQVRFETRREARRELQSDLRAVLEVQELVTVAARHVKRLRIALSNDVGDSARRHILDRDDELTWHELRIAFDETLVAAIPGARLKLAFIRARSGYNNARGVYDVLWQDAHGYANLKSSPREAALTAAAALLDESLSQMQAVGEAITDLVNKT